MYVIFLQVSSRNKLGLTGNADSYFEIVQSNWNW